MNASSSPLSKRSIAKLPSAAQRVSIGSPAPETSEGHVATGFAPDSRLEAPVRSAGKLERRAGALVAAPELRLNGISTQRRDPVAAQPVPVHARSVGGALQIGTAEGPLLRDATVTVRTMSQEHTLRLGDVQLEEGTDAAGKFLLQRFQLHGPSGAANGADKAISATLEVKSHPTRGALLVSLDYDGPELDPELGVTLAADVEAFKEGTSWSQWKTHWMDPVHVPDAQALLSLDGEHAGLAWKREGATTENVLVPLVGEHTVGTLGVDDGRWTARAAPRCGGVSRARIPLLAVGAGAQPNAVTESLYESVLASTPIKGELRRNKVLPEPFEYLTYYSWEAQHCDVDAPGCIATYEGFAAAGVPVPVLFLDDGWAQYRLEEGTARGDGSDANRRTAVSFEADPEKFPSGILGLLEATRAAGARWVGAWLAGPVHWAGISPSSELAKPEQVLTASTGILIPDPREGKALSFWRELLAGVREQGISVLKIDNQARYGSEHLRGVLPRSMGGVAIDAIYEASSELDMPMLSCMSQSPELIPNLRAAVVRSSDDYLPDNPERTKHMQYQSVGNSVLLSPFAWCDADMYQSHDQFARYHAHARAVSGGPLSISDLAHRTDAAVLLPAIDSQGKVYRLDAPGQHTRDVRHAPLRTRAIAQKVMGHHRAPGYFGGVVGAFDVKEGPGQVRGVLQAADLEGLSRDEPVAVWAGLDQALYRLDSATPEKPFQLEDMGSELFSLVPIERGLAVFGLLDKYLPPATVEGLERTAAGATITLHEAGEFGAYVSSQPSQVKVDGRALSSEEYSLASGLLRIPKRAFASETHGARVVELVGV